MGKMKLRKVYRAAVFLISIFLLCACERKEDLRNSHTEQTETEEKAKYSAEELSDVRDETVKQYDKLRREYQDTDSDEFNLLSSIAGFGTDMEKNVIYVEIADLTEEKKEMFWKLFKFYDCIELRYVEEVYETLPAEL